MTWAARLIEQHFDAVHSLRGDAATVQRWLTPLPADLIRSRPRLLLAQAVPAATGGRLEAAEQLVDAAELAYAGTDEEPFEPTIGRVGSLLVNVPAMIAICRGYLAQLRGDSRGTAEFGSRALAESREDEWILRSVAHGQLAVAGWLDGRLDEAERAFAQAIAGRRAVGLPTWGAWASYELGQVQHAQGRLDAAVRTCEQALEAAARTGQPPSPTAGPAYVGLGEVAYQRNELDSALDTVSRGIALCRSFVYTMPLAADLATLAWIRQAGGDPAGALNAMDEAVQAAPGPPGLLNPIPARRARLLLAQGDLAAPARRAMSGSSLTRAGRWPRCWPG
jgi:LuxR family maltose regulon positive regulatory protein